jgi:hypothetical protein
MLPKCIWAFDLLLRKYSGNVSSPDLFLESTFHLAHSLQFSSVRRSFLLAGSPVASTTARLQLLCLSSTTTTGGVERLPTRRMRSRNSALVPPTFMQHRSLCERVASRNCFIYLRSGRRRRARGRRGDTRYTCCRNRARPSATPHWTRKR